MKRKIAIAVCACLLLFLVFAFIYHLPRTITWSGVASSLVNHFDDEAEVTLELQEWRRFFRPWYYTGSVTVDGERFEDVREHVWIDDDVFIPQHLNENFGGRQLEIYRRFVKIFPWSEDGVEVILWDNDRDDDDPKRSRAFDIRPKA